MKKKELFKGYALVILSAFLFGCMPMVTSGIYAQGINRESVVLLRNLMAMPVLCVLTLRQKQPLRVPKAALPSIIAIALLGSCATPLLLYASYQRIATGAATVFHFVYPAVVVFIGLVFLRKKTSAAAIWASLLCVGGVILFFDPSGSLDWRGCALALASGGTYAVYVVLLSGFRYKEISSFCLSFYVTAICSAVMLCVCLAGGCLTLPTTVTGWLLCVLLAVMISVGAVVMFQKGTIMIGGERASVLSTIEPLTGVLLGIAVFRERVTLGMGIGAVLVILATVLIARSDTKHPD